MKYIFTIFIYIISINNHLLSNDYVIEMFFINDERDFDIMKFPDNSVIRQFKSAANWQDNKGDYGHLECIGHYTSIISEGTSLKNYCYGKNQKDEEFWFTMERNSEDYDAGIGNTKYLYGNGKYKNYIGIKCTYGIRIIKKEGRGFLKQKCPVD